MNQIEIRFSILARKFIRCGNFSSTQDLKAMIERFSAYFNEPWSSPSAGPTPESLSPHDPG
jgi:hypothetical protein